MGDGPRVIEAKAGGLFTLKQAEMRAGTDLLVLDTRSSNDQESAEAAREADFCVIVTRPCFFDVRSIQRTAELVNNLRKPAFIVLNQAPSRRNGEEPRLISDKYPVHFGPPATFRDEDVLIPEFNAPDGARILAQPLAGGPDRIVGYAPGAFHMPEGQSKIAVNPKTGETQIAIGLGRRVVAEGKIIRAVGNPGRLTVGDLVDIDARLVDEPAMEELDLESLEPELARDRVAERPHPAAHVEVGPEPVVCDSEAVGERAIRA